jgi:hypothetical protein
MSMPISPRRIGRWSASHRWRALILWVSFAAACVTLGAVTGTTTLSGGAVGESAAAARPAVLSGDSCGACPSGTRDRHEGGVNERTVHDRQPAYQLLR